jgi:hypothetical protein
MDRKLLWEKLPQDLVGRREGIEEFADAAALKTKKPSQKADPL